MGRMYDPTQVWAIMRGVTVVNNHTGGVGEIGGLMLNNHATIQAGTIGNVFNTNHKVGDAAPRSEDVLQFSCTEEALAKKLGLFCYAVRAYGITAPEDYFHVSEELIPGIEWLKAHYNRIGLSCAENFIHNYDFNEIGKYPNHGLSVFYYGPDAYNARPNKENRRRFNITKAMNNKNNLIRLARKLGVKTPETKLYRRIEDVNVSEYEGQFPVVVKIANSVSGLGFAKCNNSSDLKSTLAKISRNVEFQIQEYLEGAEFLSLQFWVDQNRTAIPIIGTCNFIEGDADHAGNWGDSTIPHDRLEKFLRKLMDYVAKHGFRDWGSFDVAHHDGEFYVVECNPRYTGAAYPYVIAMRLMGDSLSDTFWAHKNYAIFSNSIDGLDLGDSEYNPKTKIGWVVVNPGPLTVGNGKLGLLYIGPKELYLEQEKRLMARLNPAQHINEYDFDNERLEQFFQDAVDETGLVWKISTGGRNGDRVCRARLTHGGFMGKIYFEDERLVIEMKPGETPKYEGDVEGGEDKFTAFMRKFNGLLLEEARGATN